MPCVQTYLKAWSVVGYTLPILLIIVAALERGLQVGQNFWLSIWTDTTTAKTEENQRLDNRPYIAAYFLLGALPIALQVDLWMPQESYPAAMANDLSVRRSELAVCIF